MNPKTPSLKNETLCAGQFGSLDEDAELTHDMLVHVPGVVLVEVHELSVVIHHAGQAPLVPQHGPPHLTEQRGH
jgi:hypothetical protein